MAGNALLKSFSVNIDLKRPLAIRPFEVVEGDTGNVITLSVTDDGAAVRLANCLVTAVFSHSAGISVQDSGDGSGVTVSGNNVTIELYPTSFAPGMVECELQIYTSTENSPSGRADYDVLVTTAKFNFSCRRAILNGETIEATPQFPLLTETVANIEAAEAERAAAETERQQNELERAANEALRQSNEINRQDNEADRRIFETARASAETARASAETARASAETARASAELDRAANETLRRSNETDRNDNEIDRGIAETQRQARFEQLIASAGLGVGTAAHDPLSSTEGEAGKLIYSTASKGLFLCRGSSGGTYDWTEVEIRAKTDWKLVKQLTLTADAHEIEINTDSSGAGFLYDELRVYLIGFMSGSASASICLNGVTGKKVTFSSFGSLTTAGLANAITSVYVEKPVEGFTIVNKLIGGESASDGNASAKTTQCAAVCYGNITGYASIKFTASSASANFVSGMKVIVLGRKVP